MGQLTLYNIKKRKLFQPKLYEYSRRGKMAFFLLNASFFKICCRIPKTEGRWDINDYSELLGPYQVGQGSNSSPSLEHADNHGFLRGHECPKSF